MVNNKLTFQVETTRIIQILSSEIYDSPMALLRENLQNAYDAVLMRMELEQGTSYVPEIRLTIAGKKIHIQDNGVGMDLETLSNNFWKTGSSGKRNNAVAQAAGVIGTFGIGAMANFGVCEVLEVQTSSIKKDFTYKSKAVRDNLKIGEECIDNFAEPFNGNVGTEVIATLAPDIDIESQQCIDYLKPYIEYLQISVFINGTKYSGNQFDKRYEDGQKQAQHVLSQRNIISGGFKYDLDGYVLSNSFVNLKISNIYFQNVLEKGNITLIQGLTNIMCYRNFFGLSPIPVTTGYNFGGFANLSFLTPTAGREALNRDSIAVLNVLFASIEHQVTTLISELDIANLNTSFQKYIASRGLIELGKNLTIRVSPENREIRLRDISAYNEHKTKSFYIGTNQESLNMFANENNDLFLPSPTNPRRQIQLFFLNKFGVKQQSDEIVVKKIYDKSELDIAEGTILFKIYGVINDDYLIRDISVNFAEISHGVTSKVSLENNVLVILISKASTSIIQLKHYYEVDYSVLGPFVKDYVRAELYQKFSPYVPSSTKSGADALHKLLIKSREVFKIDIEEQGEIDLLVSDYLNNNATLAEVIKKSATISQSHTQTLSKNQIGTIEQAIPDLIAFELTQRNPVVDSPGESFEAMPPLMRLEHDTKNLKLLKTVSNGAQLNGFKLFIAISDKLYGRDKDFFFEPHTTKIIWGNHKIVYIFGHVSNKISLYYDIELKKKIGANIIGGSQFPTTTIITKDKIYIPIPEILHDSFLISENNKSKEFYIRYDLITDID